MTDCTCTECDGSGVERYEETDDGTEPVPCDACGGSGEREGCYDCGAPPDHCQCDARYEAWRDER